MTTRRKQRLPLEDYAVEGSTWHVTINVERRNGNLFHSHHFGKEVLECFVKACETDSAVVHVICIMPDHLHCLVEVRSVSLIKVIGRAKSATTRIWWARGGTNALWQESFHDPGIRERQDFDATVNYILNNPVEARLVAGWESYPLIGGTLIAG